MHTETKKVTYYSGHVIEVDGRRYEPERTCKLSESYGIGVEFDPFEGWVCDRCRMIVSHDPDKPNYCPNCGAKAVE